LLIIPERCRAASAGLAGGSCAAAVPVAALAINAKTA
jgi:hypothetical protein